MAGMAQDFISAFNSGTSAGRDARRYDTLSQFAGPAAQGDQDALAKVYAADPDAGIALDDHFTKRTEQQAKWDDYIQSHVLDVADSVRTATPDRKAKALADGIDLITGLTKRDPRFAQGFAPQLEQLRQVAATGDPQVIDEAVRPIIERANNYAARSQGGQAPKSETERYWHVINYGDPASPEYRMAYFELFSKQRPVTDPVSGQTVMMSTPVPSGVAAPGQPRQPGTAPLGVYTTGGQPVTQPAPQPTAAPAPAAPQAPARPTAPAPQRTAPLSVMAAPPARPAPSGPPQVTLPTISSDGPPPLREADVVNGRAPAMPPSAPQAANPPFKPLPMVDAFGHPLDGTVETASERRANAKTDKSKYEAQREKAAEGAGLAQRTLVDAQNFQRLNNKVNAKGSGSVGTGGFAMALPGASTLVGAVDSDIAQMNSIVSKLIPAQRPPGSGTMSDGDAAMFKSGLFGVDKPGPANNAIATGAIAASKDTIAYQRFLDLYYKKNGNADEANSLWMQYVTENPIFDPASTDNPILNTKRQPWQTYFSQRGLIDQPQATNAPATPSGPTRPDAVPGNHMDELMKKHPNRFVPLN